jgi:uncharacterized membrane protein YeiH
MELFILVFEIIGTIAFAVSGAMTGLKKEMDIFGVAILGLTAAVGGGVIRDVVLGVTPPIMFQDPLYAFVAIGTAIIIFVPAVHRWMMRNTRAYEKILILMDALGLGIFTIVGIRAAYEVSVDFNKFLLLFVGVVTGVGGGILRDVLAAIPVLYSFATFTPSRRSSVRRLRHFVDGRWNLYAMLAGMTVIVVIRLLSFHFKWNCQSKSVRQYG